MHWKSCVGFSAALIDVSDGVEDEGMQEQQRLAVKMK
jgi:hypothetical protein